MYGTEQQQQRVDNQNWLVTFKIKKYHALSQKVMEVRIEFLTDLKTRATSIDRDIRDDSFFRIFDARGAANR